MVGVVTVRLGGVASAFGGRDAVAPGAVIYPDDPVFMVKQRIEAYLGVSAHAQRLFVGGEELVQPLALLGANVATIEVRVEGETGEGEGEEERARYREVADILLRVRAAPPPGVEVGGYRFSRWRQAVDAPKGGKARVLLDVLFARALADTKALMARLVLWRGGEPSVRVKLAREAGEEAIAMERGYVPDPELGDVVELVVDYGGGARVARLRVGTTGAYAVEADASFDGVDETAVAAMQRAVGAVARALGLRAPDLGTNVLDADLDAELRTAGRRPPGIAAVREAVDARLYPFFAADAMPKALRLLYKRVPGFDGRVNVRDWIAERAASIPQEQAGATNMVQSRGFRNKGPRTLRDFPRAFPTRSVRFHKPRHC